MHDFLVVDIGRLLILYSTVQKYNTKSFKSFYLKEKKTLHSSVNNMKLNKVSIWCDPLNSRPR